MTPTWVRAVVTNQFIRMVVIHIGARIRSAPSPTSEPYHLIISLPLCKTVIRGMHRDKSTAMVDVLLKIVACRLRPISGLVAEIRNHYIVLTKVRGKIVITFRFCDVRGFPHSGKRQPILSRLPLPGVSGAGDVDFK